MKAQGGFSDSAFLVGDGYNFADKFVDQHKNAPSKKIN